MWLVRRRVSMPAIPANPYCSRKPWSEPSARQLLWRRAGSYQRQHAAVSTWLFTIARNLCVDRYRREHRMEPTPTPELVRG